MIMMKETIYEDKDYHGDASNGDAVLPGIPAIFTELKDIQNILGETETSEDILL